MVFKQKLKFSHLGSAENNKFLSKLQYICNFKLSIYHLMVLNKQFYIRVRYFFENTMLTYNITAKEIN